MKLTKLFLFLFLIFSLGCTQSTKLAGALGGTSGGNSTNGSTSVGCGERSSCSISLSWDAPSTNSDGSPLTNLASYKLYYGLNQNNLSPVNVGNVTNYTITGLASGTYYFKVTTLNSLGAESGASLQVTQSF